MPSQKLQIIVLKLMMLIIVTQNKILIENENGILEHCLIRSIFTRHENIWFLEKNFSSINYDKLLKDSSASMVLSSDLKYLTTLNRVFYNTNPILIIHNIESNNYVRVFNLVKKTTKILIIIKNHDVKPIFALAKEFQFSDVTVGVYDTNKVEFYTWFFCAPENFCGKYLKLTLLSGCGRKSTNLPNLFPNKYPKKIENCVARIGWWTSQPFVINPFIKNGPGLYISMFEAISERSGISLIYEEKNMIAEEEFLYNGFYNHLSERLANGEIDILLGHVFLNYSNLVYGPVFYEDRIVLIVPIPKRIIGYRQLLKVFNLSTMFLVLITFLLTVFCFIAMKNVCNLNADYLSVLFEVFSLTLGIPISTIPKMFSFRLLFIYYLFYGVVIDTVYLSNLSCIFGNPEYERALTDSRTLYYQNVTTNVSMFTERLTTLGFFLLHFQHLKRLISFSNESTYNLLNKVASEQTRSAFVLDSQYSAYKLQKLTVIKIYIDMMDYCRLYNTYALKPYNFINEIINYWAQEALEKGIFLKHWNAISIYYRNTSLLKEIPNTIAPYEILSLAHFEQINFIIFLGYTLALAILVLELFVNYIIKIINRTKAIAPIQ